MWFPSYIRFPFLPSLPPPHTLSILSHPRLRCSHSLSKAYTSFSSFFLFLSSSFTATSPFSSQFSVSSDFYCSLTFSTLFAYSFSFFFSYFSSSSSVSFFPFSFYPPSPAPLPLPFFVFIFPFPFFLSPFLISYPSFSSSSSFSFSSFLFTHYADLFSAY